MIIVADVMREPAMIEKALKEYPDHKGLLARKAVLEAMLYEYEVAA